MERGYRLACSNLMANVEFNIRMVRSLKGAPISILVAMMLVQQPVRAEWLERVTGYTDKPVTQALLLLEEFGLITHNSRYGWQLVKGLVQLPICVPELDSSNGSDLTCKYTGGIADENQVDPSNGLDLTWKETGGVAEGETTTGAETEEKSRNNSESELFRLSSSCINQNLDSGKRLLPLESESEKFRVEKAAECERQGIREPKKGLIVRDAKVTVRDIRYHVRTSQNTGQAIYRILNHWRVAEGWVDPEEQAEAEGEEQEIGPEIIENLEPLPGPIARGWDAALTMLRGAANQGEAATWLDDLEPEGYTGGVLRLRMTNRMGAHWLEARRRRFEGILSQECGQEIRIQIEIR